MNRRAWLLAICLSLALGTGGAQSNQQLLEDGIGALQANDFARAQQNFALLVKQDPSGRSFGYLAVAEASAGDLDEAIGHFQKAIQLGNTSARVHYNLGLAYLQQRRSVAAIGELKLAAAKDPQFRPAQHALGVAFVDAGRANEAIPYFERERNLSPKDPEVWANLIQAQFAAGHTQTAMQTADKAGDAIPNNPQLATLLANLCLDYQQPQKARHLLENASELAPQEISVKLLLAKASLAAGEPLEALAVLKEVPADAGKPGERSFLEGVALGRVGKSGEAKEKLSAAIVVDPQNADYLITYAWLEQLAGSYQESLATLDKARTLQPHSAMVPYASAVSHFLLHEYAETAESCEAAIRVAPRYAPSYLLLGLTKLKQGDIHAAEAALRRGIALQPGMAFFHRELGVALFKGGDLTASKKELDQAVSLDPKDARAYFWRAQILASQGQQKRAIEEFETVVNLQPTYGIAYGELARLYRLAGEPQKAEHALAKREALPDPEAEQDRALFLQQLYNALP